jgi:hypothetical protein
VQLTLQADIYKPNYYQSLMEFRALTLTRLRKFTEQKFFKTEDYLKGKINCRDTRPLIMKLRQVGLNAKRPNKMQLQIHAASWLLWSR